MIEMERRWALMTLMALPGMGPVQLRKLDAMLGGSVETLFQMTASQRLAYLNPALNRHLTDFEKHFNPRLVAHALKQMNADFFTFEEEAYPSALRHYPDSPIGIYRYRRDGRIEAQCIAIVGTRKPTLYGRKVARSLAAELSQCGYQIISGMAEGIDTEAHKATLQIGGCTAAFLGGGLQRCYPMSNRRLMDEISASGGVYSEFPLWRSADRRSFPQRNRIVAGVSEGVVVVESGPAGGSLITARMAAEMGKPVYVVPGRIDSIESAGCHALVRDGAQLITSVDDILIDLQSLPKALQNGGRTKQQPSAGAPKPVPHHPPLTDPTQLQIWRQLQPGESAHPDQLSTLLNTPIAMISQILLEMELDGAICRRMDGRYERA